MSKTFKSKFHLMSLICFLLSILSFVIVIFMILKLERNELLNKLIAIVVMLGILFAFGGIAYFSFYRKNKNNF